MISSIKSSMKPYTQIAIAESGDPLIAIPSLLHCLLPHPYQSLGAPYGEKSPFYLRSLVIEKLIAAEQILLELKKDWKLAIFDGYRPVVVQQFMVSHTYLELARVRELDLLQITTEQKEDLIQEVYQFWAVPSYDLNSPPPHSTGGAVDLTLIDRDGNLVDMGSEIDLISPRSHPQYFQSVEFENDPIAQKFDSDRQLLNQIMTEVGFQQHPNEWWHFCYGDQMWAWLNGLSSAVYGRV
jgi:zinc D-Ala-D-Ala dipeptidase